MIAPSRIAAVLVLTGLVFAVAMTVAAPTHSAADQHKAGPASTTTAAPASTTTAPGAVTTAPGAVTTTTAPATATPAPGSTTTTIRRATSPGASSDTARSSREATTREPTGAARRSAPALEPQGDVGPQPNLGPLLEEEPPAESGATDPERGRLSNKPLAVGGLAVGALVGLLLGLADRAAGLAVR